MHRTHTRANVYDASDLLIKQRYKCVTHELGSVDIRPHDFFMSTRSDASIIDKCVTCLTVIQVVSDDVNPLILKN